MTTILGVDPGVQGAIAMICPTGFWEKVEKTETCWLWTAALTRDGYGNVKLYGGRASGLAHRVAYQLVKGAIPAPLTLDHLCRVRHCVNPDHLEPVSRRVNTLRGVAPAAQQARQTRCKNGHPFDAGNTYLNPKGNKRRCRICMATYMANYKPGRKHTRKTE